MYFSFWWLLSSPWKSKKRKCGRRFTLSFFCIKTECKRQKRWMKIYINKAINYESSLMRLQTMTKSNYKKCETITKMKICENIGNRKFPIRIQKIRKSNRNFRTGNLYLTEIFDIPPHLCSEVLKVCGFKRSQSQYYWTDFWKKALNCSN